MTTDKHLLDYIEARRLAGTLPEGHHRWCYVGGWYRIGIFRYRRAMLVQLTANLLNRLPQPPEVTE